MLLSVIIVNYNVRYFLEQCLCSVNKAIEFSETLRRTSVHLAEIIVVDNNSTDGSVSYLQQRFPSVVFIENKQNIGFARACNQGLNAARGTFVLFLNPDTILPEDIFQNTLSFMQTTSGIGLLGIRMVDGSGRFLKESKRGLPTPWASFCKMTGLTGIFPSSKMFAGYYRGDLDEHTTQPVDVLAGAFIMGRRDLLKRVNGFDEQFFMYAEDIDLSYRVKLAGFRNFYYTASTIIHFKGESTRKDARYVRLFYKAMRQFVNKHYRSGGGLFLSGTLKIAITLRSILSLTGKKKWKLQPVAPGSVALKGDEETIDTLKPFLREKNIGVRANSDTIIYCEGPSFSFYNIIKEIQDGTGTRAFVYSSGSSSFVGSGDKDTQGEAYGL